jgi:hypothetical protein
VLTKDKRGPEIRRGLILATKILQHIANGMTAFREEYMKTSEPWVNENLKRMGDLCDEFAVSTLFI